MAIGDIYYTLRKLTGEISQFELRKWEEGRSYPLDIYEMQLQESSVGLRNVYRFQFCGCPSRANPCKHAAIALEFLDNVVWQELHYFYWQDGKIHRARDL